MMDFLETSNIGEKNFSALRAGPFFVPNNMNMSLFFNFFHINFPNFFQIFSQLFINFFQLFPELFSNYFNFLNSFFNFFATSHWVKSLILVSEPWKTQNLIPIHISQVTLGLLYLAVKSCQILPDFQERTSLLSKNHFSKKVHYSFSIPKKFSSIFTCNSSQSNELSNNWNNL